MAITSSKSCPNCGDNHRGKPFAIYEDGYHCFSCGSHKRAIRNFRTVEKLTSTLELPELEYNPERFSVALQKWLLRFHLTYEQVAKFRISEADGPSVVLPVVTNNEIVRYTRRWLGERRFYAQGDTEAMFIVSPSEGSSTVVLVEDYISCIRVGETVDCLCLFGTSLRDSWAKCILSRYDTIVIWLDNDHERVNNPGQTAAKKIKKKLENMIYWKYGLSKKSVHNILTDDDPKYYTTSQIKEILNEISISSRCSSL